MNFPRSFTKNQPVLFVRSSTFAWFALLMAFTDIASNALCKPFGDLVSGTLGRLVIIAGSLWLVWRLGWLEASGITRLGNWQVWLLALGGLIYFASASLFVFYGKVAFDISVCFVCRLPGLPF
jgi:hypothetical protein